MRQSCLPPGRGWYLSSIGPETRLSKGRDVNQRAGQYTKEAVGKVVLRDGLELAYSDVGQGPALCLVHGFTGSRDAWGRGLIQTLSESRRVVAVDLIGHVSSSVPAHHQRCRIEEIVADLIELFSALDLEEVDVVGYSMGARVSLAAAALAPTRIRRLVLQIP